MVSRAGALRPLTMFRGCRAVRYGSFGNLFSYLRHMRVGEMLGRGAGPVSSSASAMSAVSRA